MAAVQRSGINQRWFLVPLRLLIGFGFAAHGYAKLMRGPDHFTAILSALHVPAPHIMAWITTLVELLGGAAIFIGAFVALVSVPLAVTLLTAMLTVHLRYGFSSIKLLSVTAAGAKFGPPGYELDLLYIAGLFALAVAGATPLSVDAYRGSGRR